MSNGDDVLDNWEEIDEAGITNKLHKIQAERKSFEQQQQQLIKTPALSTASAAPAVNSTISSFPHPMKLLQRTQSQDTTVNTSSSSALKSPLDDMSASFQPVMMVLHQPVDEYQSANYTQPISSQTVKILRRPTQSSEPRNNGMRPRQPIKTLQQREQEYAEARLRILGSAKNPEDDATNSGTPSNNATTASLTTATTATKVNFSPKTPVTQNSSYSNNQQQQQQQTPATAYNNSNSNSYTNYNNQRSVLALPQQQEQQQQQQQQQQQTWSPIVGGNVSSSSLVRQQQQESIVRLPRGPDGSTGFQVRR